MLYKVITCFVLVFSYPICLLLSNHAATVQAYKAKGEYCIHMKPSFKLSFAKRKYFRNRIVCAQTLSQGLLWLKVLFKFNTTVPSFRKWVFESSFAQKQKACMVVKKKKNVIIWDCYSARARALFRSLFPVSFLSLAGGTRKESRDEVNMTRKRARASI